MAKIYFLLGGARSGKSEHAENLAASLSNKVSYFATAQVIDEEMKKRIEFHKRRRPQTWKTFEIEKDIILPDDLQKVIEKTILLRYEVLVVDCITNLLFRLAYKYNLDNLEVIENVLEKEIEADVISLFDRFLKTVQNACRQNNLNIILVSNEVGLGLVPPYPFGRIFRDLLGLINKKIASISDEVYFFVAGLKLKIK